ncbi:deoxyuridine 5 triP nucleotidohydrolase [Nucleospora cyclopteri]
MTVENTVKKSENVLNQLADEKKRKTSDFNKNQRTVKFYKIKKEAVVPKRHTEGAAGYDLCSQQNVAIHPSECVTIKTGLFIDLEKDLFGMIVARSGLSFKHGIEIKNSYVKDREEICIHLQNNGTEPFQVEKFMRVAQLVFIKKEERRYSNEINYL